MRTFAAATSVLLAALMWTYGVVAQSTSIEPHIPLEFCDFVPYEYTFQIAVAEGTRRQTVGYRILDEDGIKVLEKRQDDEIVQSMAIPRTTWKRTQRSLAALPDLRPLSTRIVTHQWNQKDGEKESVAEWTTEKIAADFAGDTVSREIKGSHRKTETQKRTLPAGIRQSEMQPVVFAHFAGPRPPASMRLRVYNALTDSVEETGWEMKGEEAVTVTVLGQQYRAWPVRVGTAESDAVSYYRADRPRIFLGADRIDRGQAVRYYKLVRLWFEGPTSAGACDTSSGSALNTDDVEEKGRRAFERLHGAARSSDGVRP